jgi:cyd operon protein YbgT
MWYFSWILGTGLALAFGVLNAIWYEIMDPPAGERKADRSAPDD